MSAATCATGWSVGVAGLAMGLVALAGWAPWPVAVAGAAAAMAGMSASLLSARRAASNPSPICISPQQAMALGIPMAGERSSRFGQEGETLVFPVTSDTKKPDGHESKATSRAA